MGSYLSGSVYCTHSSFVSVDYDLERRRSGNSDNHASTACHDFPRYRFVSIIIMLLYMSAISGYINSAYGHSLFKLAYLGSFSSGTRLMQGAIVKTK